MTLSERDRLALEGVLTDAEFPELPNFHRGKVRDSYNLADGRRIMVATDRQSAFDHVLAAVPFKGQVLTQTARYWFDQTSDICPNHVIGYPDPNVLVAKTLKIMPIEMVVRDYMTGSTDTSIWPMYQRGERMLYGHQFPDGMVKNQKLPETILTPTTKADQGVHDTPTTAVEIVQRGILTQQQWDDVIVKCLAVFSRGREIAARNGLILVDTKFEFGVDEDGAIILADEILTPDSSRYWKSESYALRLAAGEEPESLDKEFLRLWVRAQCDPYKEPIPDIPPETLIEFSGKYISLFETVTGRKFEYPDTSMPVRDRVREALARAFSQFF
jgi:phosphoribosylaminoimidazole-succinocarboxamide synthase